MAIFFLIFFFCYLKTISSLRQNDRDHRDISSIFEGPWRVTDELNEMVQYFKSSQIKKIQTVNKLFYII